MTISSKNCKLNFYRVCFEFQNKRNCPLLKVHSHEMRNELKPVGDFILVENLTWCSVSSSLCSHELRQNETQASMDFISIILTKMKFQTGMKFSYEQNLPRMKRISTDSLVVAFNEHVGLKLIAGVISLWLFWKKWNFISNDKISCKHYPKWNAYICPTKYWVVLKCSQNEMSCEENLFSCRFESQTGMSSFQLSC